MSHIFVKLLQAIMTCLFFFFPRGWFKNIITSSLDISVWIVEASATELKLCNANLLKAYVAKNIFELLLELETKKMQ